MIKVLKITVMGQLTHLAFTTVSIALLLSAVPASVDAQQINNPTHIPNAQRRKIMNIQLLGKVKEAEVTADVDDALDTFLPKLDGLSDVADCSLNIGTTDTQGNSLSRVERDIVIAGDVINLCN